MTLENRLKKLEGKLPKPLPPASPALTPEQIKMVLRAALAAFQAGNEDGPWPGNLDPVKNDPEALELMRQILWTIRTARGDEDLGCATPEPDDEMSIRVREMMKQSFHQPDTAA